MGVRELRDTLRVSGLVRSSIQIALLRGGLEEGLFAQLRTPRTAAELASEHGTDRDLLTAWLRAAHAHGLLDRVGNAYRASRFTAWLLEEGGGDAARAMIEEAVHAYAPVLGRMPEMLRTGERPTWLGDAEAAERVARGSRLTEPRSLRALQRVPGVKDARRLLDIGCGDGAYLVDFLERHRDAIGDGVELEAGVAERARERLHAAEVHRRAEVHVGDYRALELPHGSYDLVLLNNNLYYFAEEEREALFRRILDHLSPAGVLAIQSLTVSDDPLSRIAGMTATAAAFDAFLRIHRDLAGLPEPDVLRDQLLAAGFDAAGDLSVVPGGSLRYVWARKSKGNSR